MKSQHNTDTRWYHDGYDNKAYKVINDYNYQLAIFSLHDYSYHCRSVWWQQAPNPGKSTEDRSGERGLQPCGESNITAVTLVQQGGNS